MIVHIIQRESSSYHSSMASAQSQITTHVAHFKGSMKLLSQHIKVLDYKVSGTLSCHDGSKINPTLESRLLKLTIILLDEHTIVNRACKKLHNVILHNIATGLHYRIYTPVLFTQG